MSKLSKMLEKPVEELTPQEWVKQIALFYNPEALQNLIVEHIIEEVTQDPPHPPPSQERD